MNKKEEFESIYRATFNTISKQVYFRVAKLEDAEDIVQEIYLDFYKYIIAKGKTVENVQAYLIQMSINKLSHYYKDKTIEFTVEDDQTLFNNIEEPSNLEFDTLEKISLDEIWEAVKTLSDIDQHILIDYYRFGFNFREISERYNMPESTIKSRCSNAIKQLKEIVK
jgi:RNA polymerase sigma-70 factor (ECF subfamily)